RSALAKRQPLYRHALGGDAALARPPRPGFDSLGRAGGRRDDRSARAAQPRRYRAISRTASRFAFGGGAHGHRPVPGHPHRSGRAGFSGARGPSRRPPGYGEARTSGAVQTQDPRDLPVSRSPRPPQPAFAPFSPGGDRAFARRKGSFSRRARPRPSARPARTRSRASRGSALPGHGAHGTAADAL